MPIVLREVLPASRIDLMVAAADGSPRLLSIHTGHLVTDWERGERFVKGGASYPISFFLPDGHAYTEPPEAVSGTVALARFGLLDGQLVAEGPYGVDTPAFGHAPDPRGNGLHWGQVSFTIYAPARRFDCAYTAHVLARPDTVAG